MSAWIFWLIVAAVMLIAELMTGILFCLCLCIAALLTVAVSGVLPPIGQGVVFSILSAIFLVIFLVIWANWRKKQTALEKPIVSEIQHHLMGLELRLSAALEPEAQIRVGDSYWLARSENGQSITVGTKVKVVAIEGTMLVVKVV